MELYNVDLIFDMSDFGEGDISFNNSSYRKLSIAGCHLNNYIDLRINKAEEVDLSDTIARDIIDFLPDATKVEIGVLNLNGLKLLGRIYIDWFANNVKSLIENQPESTNFQKANQFRILKENFFLNGHYNDEDRSYLHFKRHEALSKLDKVKNASWKVKIPQRLSYAFEWILFDKVGGYATQPVRVLLSMFITYLLFAITYIVMDKISLGEIIYGIGDEHLLNSISKSGYFSAITFLTIGYGDFYPVGIDRFLAGLEGFTGLFLMSYFTVAFVRKILR